MLFGENLAPGLVRALAQHFPGSAHVHDLQLGSADDLTVWRHARDNGFTIVTKDSDFHERSLVDGYPPKVVWIRRGNCSTAKIEAILIAHVEDLRRLDTDPDSAVLVLV